MLKFSKFARRSTLVSAFVTIIVFAVWQFSPLQAVVALSNLTDPDKLATLGERGANSRLNKIVFWLDTANNRGMGVESAVNWAQILNGSREPRASLVQSSLSRNFKIATELGLLTTENLERLKRGNELANLEMMPKTLNRKKSNRVGERQLAHAQTLFKAKLLQPESLERVKQHLLN